MKILLRLVFVFLLLHKNSFASSDIGTVTVTVNQQIRYSCEGAEEVVLVWGINNWNLPNEKLRPPGTICKDGLLYSTMIKEGNIFFINLNVPPGTKIDYVFWIKKGPLTKKTDVWDLNKKPQKDYHTIALQDNIVVIESDLQVKPKEALTLLDFSMTFFLFSMLLLMIILGVKKIFFKKENVKLDPKLIIIATSLALLFFLCMVRASVLGISWDLYFSLGTFISKLIWGSVYDFLYVICLSVIFLGAIFGLKKFPKMQLWVAGLFGVGSLFSLVIGLLNIKVVEILGKPFNWQWFYYSDFLKSSDARSAMSSNIDKGYMLHIAFVCLAAVLLAWVVFILMNFIFSHRKIKHIFIGIGMLLCIFYFVIAFKKIETKNYDRMANPVVAFIGSTGLFSEDVKLFSMPVPDSLVFKKANKKNLYRRDTSFAKIKNVILFVMESTPAEYIDLYGSKYHVTPELEKCRSDAIVFENIYAHAPATNLSMVSILGSVYPWLSYASVTQEHPSIKIPTLSSELKAKGYRTAFFNSADNRFQKAGEFLANRNFDKIKDCQNINCTKEQYNVKDDKWDFLNGKNDECTSDDLLSWVKEDSRKPFFAMMWTYETHYPYFAPGNQINYTNSDTVFNRYLNALHHSDLILGKIIEELKKNGLYESTLVVVVGDHGEAFGRHEQITHASKIYEENLHVPCVFVNPAFATKRNSSLGGLVDIAPSIMDVLGYSPSREWQGKGLLSSDGSDCVYFFSPWSDFLFGYRQGDFKYIFNASNNTTEIYDLKKDPMEERNICSFVSDQRDLCHLRLAAWTQYVNEFMEMKLK